MAVNSTIDFIEWWMAQEDTVGTLVTSGLGGLLVTTPESPMNMGVDAPVVPKARGTSYLQTPASGNKDIQKLNRSPGASPPFEANADSLAVMLATFFQKITKSGSGPYVVQYDPLITSMQGVVKLGAVAGVDGDYAMTLYKIRESSQTYSEYFTGVIMSGLELTSSEDSPILQASPTLIAMTHDTMYDAAALSATAIDKAPILHSDLTTTLAGSSIELLTQTLTLSYENVKPVFGPNNTPQAFYLQGLRVGVDITFTADFSGTDFKAGHTDNTDYLFEMYKGSKTGTTAEDFYFQSNILLSADPLVENANGQEVFHLVGQGAYDGTNPACQIILATATDRVTEA